jgi:hypothetical protein
MSVRTANLSRSASQMNRQMFVDRLRAWATRAENEVAYSEGTGKITWQCQASVLRATASVVASGSATNSDPVALRKQLIADRQKALMAWEQTTDAATAAGHSGEVAAYELIITLLRDVGERWSA